MSRLPRISGRECINVLGKVSFFPIRQKGSHITVRRDDPFAQTVVPDHKELSKGTLRRIIRDCGLSVDKFIDLLNDEQP
jgi:predicted RNA binding protein YcfA (HicA-like mRNA interferase family)